MSGGIFVATASSWGSDGISCGLSFLKETIASASSFNNTVAMLLKEKPREMTASESGSDRSEVSEFKSLRTADSGFCCETRRHQMEVHEGEERI